MRKTIVPVFVSEDRGSVYIDKGTDFFVFF